MSWGAFYHVMLSPRISGVMLVHQHGSIRSDKIRELPGHFPYNVENASFLEALRRRRPQVDKYRRLHVLVTLVPLFINDEPETGLTQAAMREILFTEHKLGMMAETRMTALRVCKRKGGK